MGRRRITLQKLLNLLNNSIYYHFLRILVHACPHMTGGLKLVHQVGFLQMGL